ncbi:MAG: hypothetical protein A2583_00405 [Bdellovibrionales bacterium RIFOXYD1_FULL_53_11]|nr:MAG: hypothetical protein A2583_00405 [Bdellovibrionales bacterium RIFOXYD1_FULL_53_11]
MDKYIFFDNASTTKCCPAALECVRRFACDEYANPSSSHKPGREAARAISKAREFFADHFNVEPKQVIFTASGSESDNLAIYGSALGDKSDARQTITVLTTTTEHPAVRKTAASLAKFGVNHITVPVSSGSIDETALMQCCDVNKNLVCSIHQVNNITGALYDVETLAGKVKSRAKGRAVFHTDAVQAFGKIRSPSWPSAVDMLSISSHKLHGPKGIGALIVLNSRILEQGLRPLVWGGGQEGGWRSGTQSPGLVAGFHAAALEAIQNMQSRTATFQKLREQLFFNLEATGTLRHLRTNSPDTAVPYIINLSAPGIPAGPFARMIEEHGVIVATGSACESGKVSSDPVLDAMGLEPAISSSAIRISFSHLNTAGEIDRLSDAIKQSLETLSSSLPGRRQR